VLADAVAALGAGVGDADFEEPFSLGPPRLDCAQAAGCLNNVRLRADGQESARAPQL
jgi:hypothetical protein